MKAHLLYRDRDFDTTRPLPWNAEELSKDLALETLFTALASGDRLVFDVARKVILSGFQMDVATVVYRQQILQDCLKHPQVVRELYSLSVDALEYDRKSFFLSFIHYPNSVLWRSVESMEKFLHSLEKLKRMADVQFDSFSSEGWCALFATLRAELTDEYFARARSHLEELKFKRGMELSAALGEGNKEVGYVLHLVPLPDRRVARWLRAVAEWLRRTFRGEGLTQRSKRQPPFLQFSLDPRDEAGIRALGELRDRGIALVANTLAQSTDHVRSFFNALRTELAFYVGCVNLHEELTRKGSPTCFPAPTVRNDRRLSFRSLSDVSLALTMEVGVVGNDLHADKQNLLLVTGANQGGKSTFLRSVGLAQLMMQCGMFVAAEAFSSSLYDGLFTHYKREADPSMSSGKLDEELARMSDIVDHLTIHSMILFNESFAATNEREGSEIARGIIAALLEKQVKILFVTHLYEFANSFRERDLGGVLFLRANRQSDGTRTFRLVVGKPLQTSFGKDLYNTIFGAEGAHSEAM